MARNALPAAAAALATILVTGPALAYCGTFVPHSTIQGCEYIRLPGDTKPFVLQGKIPARGSCPAKNANGTLEYRITRAGPPQDLGDGFCGMKGWKDFNPTTKKTRRGTIG